MLRESKRGFDGSELLKIDSEAQIVQKRLKSSEL